MTNTYLTYSLKDASGIFGFKESRLRYWAATGFISPTGEHLGEYTFRDLIEIKTAKKLLEAGLSLQAVRKHLLALRKALPDEQHVLHRLRISGSKEKLYVSNGGSIQDPISGQLILDFESSSFSQEVDLRLQSHRASSPEKSVFEIDARSSHDNVVETDRDVFPKDAGTQGSATEVDEVICSDMADVAMRLFVKAHSMISSEKMANEDICWEKMRDIYLDVVKYDGTFAEAYVNLGVSYFELQQYQLAKQAYEHALDIDTQLQEVHYNLASLHEILDQPEEAIRGYRNALEINPVFSDAHYNLARLLSLCDRQQEALVHWRRFLKLTRKEPGLDSWRAIASQESRRVQSTA